MQKFIALALFAFISGCVASQDIRSETTCQTHKRSATTGRSILQWDIQCDAQGNYLPLQCTKEKPKWCACYSKEKQVTSPSRSTKSCECFLAKEVAEKNPANSCDIPVCERSGKFQKKQCCPRTQKCHCVDPITGQKTTQPTNNMNLSCA